MNKKSIIFIIPVLIIAMLLVGCVSPKPISAVDTAVPDTNAADTDAVISPDSASGNVGTLLSADDKSDAAPYELAPIDTDAKASLGCGYISIYNIPEDTSASDAVVAELEFPEDAEVCLDCGFRNLYGASTSDFYQDYADNK